MEIQILQLLEGARQAKGLAVIIDVFRAFSVACYAYGGGARRVIPVGDLELAYSIKAEHPEYILMGERKGRKLEGFSFGNSPAAIEEADIRGKTLIHTTSAGTQGIANAVSADEILTGSFVNAKAIAEYIRSRDPQQVSLVCMGNEANSPADEDTFCAEYIRSLLLNQAYSLDSISENLRLGGGKRFFKPENASWAPERDFHLCLDYNRFHFVLKAEKQPEGWHTLEKIDLSFGS